MVQKLFRDEANEIKKLKGWIVIYGRRKTGKTFLIKNFLTYDAFFMIRRDGKILVEKIFPKHITDINDFIKIISDMLKENKTVVIDEFQRLPSFIFDELSALHPKGRIIFSGSSMRTINKFFGKKSALLGMALQFRLDLIRAKNIVRELSKKVDKIKAIELSPYLRDPWTIQFFKKESTLKILYEILTYSKFTVPALIGEVFTEEERGLTKVYEAILRIIGSGVWDYKILAGILSSRKVIERADSSLVLPYIKNLQKMGLIEKLSLFRTKKKMYKLRSPIMEAFYYLSDRYNFEERELSFEEIVPTLNKIKTLAIQNFIADIFAEYYGGKKEYFVSPEKEIDFIITLRNKSIATGEVKWGKYEKKDIERFREKVKDINGEKFFIVKEKKEKKYKEIKIIDASDLIKICKK